MPKTSRLSYSGSYKENNKEKLYFTQKTTVLWMPISVGQPYHESDTLHEILNLLTKHFINVPLVNVVIADTAQRYSLAIKNKKTPEEMRNQANKEGSRWEELYKDLIEKHFQRSKVIFQRWDEWTNHDLYKESRQKIDDLYNQKELGFYSAIEKDVLIFEKRYSSREGVFFSDKEREYCRECLKEECAVLIVWGKALIYPNYSCLFYPKPMTNSILFINENYTWFMSMFSELKSKTKRGIFYSNLNVENIVPNVENDVDCQTHSFSKINFS